MARFGLLLGLLTLPWLAGCGSGGDTVTPTYFVVSERVPVVGDSYLLPLTDPDDIAQARFQMSNIDGRGQIVVARIARGSSDGVTDNRDVLHGGRRWSWHVTEFEGFADATIEILDGSATYVEANLEEWMAITSGRIGFWNYVVTQELSPDDL